MIAQAGHCRLDQRCSCARDEVYPRREPQHGSAELQAEPVTLSIMLRLGGGGHRWSREGRSEHCCAREGEQRRTRCGLGLGQASGRKSQEELGAEKESLEWHGGQHQPTEYFCPAVPPDGLPLRRLCLPGVRVFPGVNGGHQILNPLVPQTPLYRYRRSPTASSTSRDSLPGAYTGGRPIDTYTD